VKSSYQSAVTQNTHDTVENLMYKLHKKIMKLFQMNVLEPYILSL